MELLPREHANDCQYVAIKDNIGLCTYCQAQDHQYAACPQQTLDQETVTREMKKNKKNNKKRGKVKIVAGIMTREQESDSTLSPEKEEGGVETPSPQRLDGRQGYQHPLHGGYLSQPVITPKEMMYSFCGGNTHDYRDCPMMHQYIREQAGCISPKEAGRIPTTTGVGGDMKSQGKCHFIRDRSLEEGDQVKVDQSLGRGLLRKSPKNRGHPLSQEKLEQLTHILWGAWLQGVGEELHHQVGGGPPDDKRDNESDEEENEEDDTDEETVSVTPPVVRFQPIG